MKRLKNADIILDKDGDIDWFMGKMAQDMAKTMKIGRRPNPKNKRVYQSLETKCKKAQHLQALKELEAWLDKYKEKEYIDYQLQVKAEVDRIISKYWAKRGVNYAKLGR